MREILFRGKAVDNGEFLNCKGNWVEGGITFFKDGTPYICPERFSDYNEEIEVDPETVSEFTGLTDKNGKRIFEGDIVEYNSEGIQRDIVVWSLGEYRKTAGFGLKRHIFYSIESEDSKIFEVIGNKWDNPELLKGE